MIIIQRLFPLLLCVMLQIFAAPATLYGQQRVSVGFYNVENLFDTIPSPFYDDRAFTPEGRHKWNTERYNQKLANLAAVIDAMHLDIVGLAEVENEEVVRDLVETLRDDYNYIHRPSGDRRGIDQALLYRGDVFFPDSVEQFNSGFSRKHLHVSGTVLGERINVVVCHMPSKMNSEKHRQKTMNRLYAVADSIRTSEPAPKLIVMGDLNHDPDEKVFRNTFGRKDCGYYVGATMYGALGHEKGKFGSYVWKNQWLLYDNILINSGLVDCEGLKHDYGGAFVMEFMLAPEKPTAKSGGSSGAKVRYPLRTIDSGRYKGGYSDHLPVFMILSQ